MERAAAKAKQNKCRVELLMGRSYLVTSAIMDTAVQSMRGR